MSLVSAFLFFESCLLARIFLSFTVQMGPEGSRFCIRYLKVQRVYIRAARHRSFSRIRGKARINQQSVGPRLHRVRPTVTIAFTFGVQNRNCQCSLTSAAHRFCVKNSNTATPTPRSRLPRSCSWKEPINARGERAPAKSRGGAAQRRAGPNFRPFGTGAR